MSILDETTADQLKIQFIDGDLVFFNDRDTPIVGIHIGEFFRLVESEADAIDDGVYYAIELQEYIDGDGE